MRSVLWLRRDFRLDDHPALVAAARNPAPLAIVWVDDPDDAERYGEGTASRWWLEHSLKSLDARLGGLGQRLLVLQGRAHERLEELVRRERVTNLYAHRRHEPLAIADEERLARALAPLPVRLQLIADAHLHEPGEILTAEGRPYRIFTPFWRRLEDELARRPARPLDPPPSLPAPWTPATVPFTIPDEAFGVNPSWTRRFAELWKPGADAARERSRAFLASGVGAYAEDRHRLDREATSRLSPHLHFGELSARRLETLARERAAATPAARAGIDAFRRQLAWREFARHVLVHDPAIVHEPFDRRYRNFPWTDGGARFEAWRDGRLGIPLLDAAMRELWHTGFMHNRARMNVASFLTRQLNVHWRRGLAWFAETLLDADLANNVFGWQWSAGCGADAAVYVRLFNPGLQARRFDPEGRYLARHLALPPPVPPARGGRGPAVTLDLAALRREALERYERWRHVRPSGSSPR